MWDLASYYRQIHTPPINWASHCRAWVGDSGPSVVVDHAVMFGDAPASNWAMRLSGLIAHLVAEVVNAAEPTDPRVQLAFRLQRWADKNDPNKAPAQLLHSFVSCFIDDFSI